MGDRLLPGNQMNNDSRAKEIDRMFGNVGNPISGFIWRSLACCFVLAAGIWGYFTFVKKCIYFCWATTDL